jgi:hypothetical protein
MSSTPSSSRLSSARRRARFVKVASAGAAAVGFGLLSVLVRGAHAGGGTATATTAGGSLGVSSRISQEAAQSSSFFGSGSVGSSASSGSPQASTHTS